LNQFGNPADFEWDVVIGTSVGSVNAAVIGAWPKERGRQMSQYISSHWSKLNTKGDVYEDAPED